MHTFRPGLSVTPDWKNMKKFACAILTLFALSIFGWGEARGQEDSLSISVGVIELVKLDLVNGRTIEGEILEENESFLRLQTEGLGVIQVQKIDILGRTAIDGLTVQREPRANPQSSRYFFAPSGIQLRKGEGYYQNGYLVYSQVSYGITDNVTLGVPIIPFIGAGLTGKLGGTLYGDREIGGVHASAGGIVLFDWTSNFLDGPVGIAFANVTFGREVANFTISLGNAFSDGANQPVWNASLMLPLNDQTWLMSENYLIDDAVLASVGIRRASRTKDSLFDYAMVMISDGSATIPLPWISWTLSFD